MKHLYRTCLAIAVMACCLHGQKAEADSDFFPMITSVETNYVGLGVGALPDYIGSDDYTWGVAPMARYEFGNHRNIVLTGNYLESNLINHDVLRFGPVLRYRFGRDDDVDDPVVALLPELDDTVEGGLMLAGTWILDNNPRKRFTAGVDGLWDMGGTSDGFNGSLFARYWTPASQMIDVGIGAALRYSDDNFTDTYFGVNAAGAVASGLPMFEAEGGITSFDITPVAVFHLNEKWHVGTGLRYSILGGDAADSPIVEQRGDDSQWVAGIGVVYSWGSKVNQSSMYQEAP